MKGKRTPLRSETFVYFVQCNGATGPVKIGFSRDVNDRIAKMQIGSPYPLVLLGKFKCENPPDFEAQLHELFGDLHIRGEWFRYSPEYGRLISGMLEIERLFVDLDVKVSIRRRRP